MIKESEYWSKIIETELNKPIHMTKKYKKDFKNSTKCWICKTGKNQGFAHHHWNLSLSLSKKTLLCFII